jgi:YegS/Rv2252/BmrU family lipid kinase
MNETLERGASSEAGLKGPYVFIVNPQSAAGSTRRRFERVRARFQAALPSLQVRLTEGPGHATELAREAVREGVAAVVAVGGDGTNNEVVNGFFDEAGERIESPTVFGAVTSGTGGDFRRTLGWTLEPRDDLARIEANRRRTIDVGRVRFRKKDGGEGVRCFVNIGSFGMSGAIVETVNAGSKALGAKGSFLSATLRQMLSYRAPRVRLTLDDDEPRDMAITTVAVANGQYFGGGMWIAPDARIDDGAFEVVVIKGASVGFWIKHGLKVYSGAHKDLAEVVCQPCRKVRAEPLDGAEILLELDGEQPGMLPATFELLPGCLQILC